jgi:hypothetical protein
LRLYRFGQQKLTRSLLPTRARVAQKIDVAFQYWDWLEKHGASRSLLEGTHLDFGAGWHPTIPLLFYALGVERQFLFDATPLLQPQMAADTEKAFRAIVSDSAWPHRARLRRLPEPAVFADQTWPGCLERLGMRYCAPCDDQFADIAGSVDVATCTQVLYYVRKSALSPCLARIYSSLKPGGRLFATLRLTTPDFTGLSDYGHLRFSPWVWDNLVNSAILSYNRLKPSDYRAALETAGFRITHFQVNHSTQQDWSDLNAVSLHSSFDRYSRDDLVIKQLFLVAEKPWPGDPDIHRSTVGVVSGGETISTPHLGP